MLKKPYYSIKEVVKILHIEIEEICSYVREGIIKPVIYIDSRPVHACELNNSQDSYVIAGFCFLSAYWNVGDNIIAISDALLREDFVPIRNVVKVEDICYMRPLMSWSTDSNSFHNIDPNYIALKPFAHDLPIKSFVLLKQNEPFKIFIKNIAISYEDLEFLSKNSSSSNDTPMNSAIDPRLDSIDKKKEELMKSIHEIQTQAQKLGCPFDIEAMPGTKSEFIAFLRTRYPKATFCSITDETIQDYFKELGIKFKRGVKTNKCPIFTKLIQIPDTSN